MTWRPPCKDSPRAPSTVPVRGTAHAAPSRTPSRDAAIAAGRQLRAPRQRTDGASQGWSFLVPFPRLAWDRHAERLERTLWSGPANELRDLRSERQRGRRRGPQVLVFAVGARNQADFAGFVEALQDSVDDREVARVNGEIDADREQALAHFHRRHGNAAAQREPDHVGEPHRHRGRQADQLRQRADGLGELRKALVDLAALLAERFVFLDGGRQGGPVVFRRHDTILYIMYNYVSTGRLKAGR